MELTLKEIVIPAIGIIGTILFTWGGFFFKAYLKANEAKLQSLTDAIELQQKENKEERKEISDTLDAIKNQINIISNEFSKLDYKQIITEEDVKELLKKSATHSLDIQRIKDFHNSHHKDDRIQ